MYRQRRRRTQPYTREEQYGIAYLVLVQQDGRRRTSGSRSEAQTRRVRPSGPGVWAVTGGSCMHVVARQPDGRLVCLDHEPAHPRTEGNMCCHEFAVYKMIAWENIPNLFTPDGFRIKEHAPQCGTATIAAQREP